MNYSKAWIITRKDFSVYRRKSSVLYALVAFPVLIGIGLPAILDLVQRRHSLSAAAIIPLMDSFSFFFVVLGVVLATNLASYSLVGEKVEKSLEPLLATPTSDSEILLGKTLAAFLPTLAAAWIGATIYMGSMDLVTRGILGYFFYPNETIAVFLVIAAPLACLFSVQGNVLLSAHATDVRTAQQLGSMLVLPFAAFYVLGETGLLTLDTNFLLELSAVLAVADLLLFQLCRVSFRREEILTKWK